MLEELVGMGMMCNHSHKEERSRARKKGTREKEIVLSLNKKGQKNHYDHEPVSSGVRKMGRGEGGRIGTNYLAENARVTGAQIERVNMAIQHVTSSKKIGRQLSRMSWVRESDGGSGGKGKAEKSHVFCTRRYYITVEDGKRPGVDQEAIRI